MAKQKNKEDVFALLNDLLSSMAESGSTPNELERRRKEESIREILGLSSTALKGLDAFKREKELTKESNRLKKPISPAKRSKSKIVQEALDKARKVLSQPLSPLELGSMSKADLDQYFQDRKVAQTASTGNASTYGAMMQGSANRRLRNNQDRLSQMAGQRRAGLSAFNQAAGMDLREDEGIFRDNFNLYQNELGQYNAESQAIGRGLASSRLSKLAAGDALIDPLSRIGSRVDFDQITGMFGRSRGQEGVEGNGIGSYQMAAPQQYDYDSLHDGIGEYNNYLNSINVGSAFDPFNYNAVPRSKRYNFNS